MYTLEKNNTSPLCTLCMLRPQIIPHLTLMLVHMWALWRVHPPTCGSCEDRKTYWNCWKCYIFMVMMFIWHQSLTYYHLQSHSCHSNKTFQTTKDLCHPCKLKVRNLNLPLPYKVFFFLRGMTCELASKTIH